MQDFVAQAGDFRNLTPLVLMNALKEAGTVVCEPIHRFSLEVPVDLDVAISSLQGPKQLAVIDCLTVYLANVMSKAEGKESVIRDHMERLCSALKETRASIILVSNEVGSGVHAATATGRFYCDLLGELNQRVAALADNVILMVAGIPVAVKGKVPLAAHSTFEIDHEVLGAARL